jgi:PKHD-type hydroxylase
MLVHIEGVLTAEEVAAARATLQAAPWVDGKVTAGTQSALAKRNLQVPQDDPSALALAETILKRLGGNQTFVSAALPLQVFPPLFNRYDVGMAFDSHIDNAIRFFGPTRYRTDLSATLFLTDPDDYDGGELVIEDTYGEHAVKLAAGDLILYPASSRHRVEAITRGARWAAFFWVQSMIRDDGQRSLLHDMDRAIQTLAARVGQDDPAVLTLAGGYHNLIRMWGEV